MQERVQITEEEWYMEAMIFKTAFVHAFSEEDVTTYIHIFVDHLGYWLAKFSCIEQFSGFGIEHLHCTIRRVIHTQTNGWKGILTGQCLLAKQVLQALYRIRLASASSPVQQAAPNTDNNTKTWAHRNIKKYPEMKKYLALIATTQ
jgi:hypothetical protein